MVVAGHVEHTQLGEVGDFGRQRPGQPVVGQRKLHDAAVFGCHSVPVVQLRVGSPRATVFPRLAVGQAVELRHGKPFDPSGIALHLAAGRDPLQPLLELGVDLWAKAGVFENQLLQVLDREQGPRQQSRQRRVAAQGQVLQRADRPDLGWNPATERIVVQIQDSQRETAQKRRNPAT